jgi:anti-anti-sigma regulatory factor
MCPPELLVATPHIRTNYLTQSGVWRVEVDGVLDVTTAGRVAVTVRRMARAGHPIVVDLARARFIDGSIMRALNAAREDVEAHGSALLVVLGGRRSDPEVLMLPPVGDAFESVGDALASLAPARRVI